MSLKTAISILLAVFCLTLQSQDFLKAAYEVETLDFMDFKDSARENREVPMRVYVPEGTGPFPLIIFSHGLGGSKEGYSYLGKYWASRGFVVAHVQHKGSDSELIGPGMAINMVRAMTSQENLVNRPKDISFAIDKMIELNGFYHGLKDRVNPLEIGVAGHSFGAYTTLAVAGQKVGRGEYDFRDKRVKAAIEMSAPGKTFRSGKLNTYADIEIPMMHFTGSADAMPGGSDPADRLIPFKSIGATNQYLIVFDGGKHMLFSGRKGRDSDEAKDPKRHELIQKASAAFWMAYLKGDAKALEYLKSDSMDGLKAALGNEAYIQRK